MGLFHREHTAVDRGTDAESVKRRLAAVAQARPCDRARVESALREHLAAMEMAPRPVRWVEGADAEQAARQGFLTFWLSHYKHGKPAGPGMTFTSTHQALFGSGLRTTGLVGPALEAEKQAGVKKSARHSVYSMHSAFTRGATDQFNVDVVGPSAGLGAAMAAARAALAEKGIYQSSGIVPGQAQAKLAQGAVQLKEEVEIASAPGQALETANWLARAHTQREAGGDTAAHDHLVGAYRPLVDAVEAGLWLFWVTDDEVIAVAAADH